jgi:hypothetical protein
MIYELCDRYARRSASHAYAIAFSDEAAELRLIADSHEVRLYCRRQ